MTSPLWKFPSLYSQYLASILRINPHSLPAKSKAFDSFRWWIPCKHNNISWNHSNTSENPYVWTILHGESHQNYRRIPMKSLTSPCSYGCHTGQVQLQRPGRRRSHSADLDQHRRQRHMQEIQRKRKLEELEGNHTSDIFSILICFDLFWFVDLKSDEILVIEDDISSWFVSILHPNSWPIAPLQLAIKVIWWLSHPFEEYDNMLVIGDQHPISVIIFEQIHQFWSDPIWPTLAHGPWQSLSKGRSSTAMW